MNSIIRQLGCSLFLFSMVLGASAAAPVFTSNEYAFKRLFAQAKADPKWKRCHTLTDRLWLVRDYSKKHATVSDPVSDRYMITCYGGAIDLVHFLCLSANLCSWKHGLSKRLYQEWLAEGGMENQGRFNYDSPPEAHPDDLPSNAFGALFGKELRKHNETLDFDIEAAFEAFVRPLIPVPDRVARKFSHRSIVMGLPMNPSRQLKESRKAYFTALPLVQCRKLNEAAQDVLGISLCEELTGEEALTKAGFRLLSYKGQPIIIRRLPKTAHK